MQWNLIRIRKENGLTQKKMAEILGIAADTYGMKERGKLQFTQDEMFFLSRYFNLPLEVIFLPRDLGKTEKKKKEVAASANN